MQKIILRSLVSLTVLLMGSLAIVGAQEDTTDPADDDVPQVAVTIYNEGSALVQDRRTFSFDVGTNIINFTDVAASIDPTSVNFVSLTDPDGTSVLEQNYVYDLVGMSALLQRYIDETIRVTTSDGTIYEGQLLSGSGEIILRGADGSVFVVSRDNIRDVTFPNLPDGLITRPTLRWLIDSQNGGDQAVELTYLTNGISWTADYNLLLATDNQSLDLNGWVTLNNNSGAAYENALIKLVAGDVNRVQPEMIMEDVMMMADMPESRAGQQVEQREFFQYQLYQIGRPVTVGNNETKQIEFVTGTNVPSELYFVYDSSVPFYGYGGLYTEQYYGQTGITDVQNWIQFTTAEESGLGSDLPAGRVRVYQQDEDGAALLIGENRIDHTPQGEDIQFYLGNAFDLVGERVQTQFDLIGSNVVEETFEIRLRNRKDDETVQIRVPERLSRGSNWEIVNSSMAYEQTSAFAIEFRADVPAGEEVVITYTVRYTDR